MSIHRPEEPRPLSVDEIRTIKTTTGTQDPNTMVAHWTPTIGEQPMVTTITHKGEHMDITRPSTHPAMTMKPKAKKTAAR